MRIHPSLIAVALLTLSGCRLPEDEWGVVKVIWNDFPWWSVVWRLVAWTGGGALVGLIVGVVGSLLLRRWGAYRLPWARVRYWLTLVLFKLNFIATPILCGTIGFFEGVFHSGAFAIRHSVIGKEWLPAIAQHGADGLAMADVILEKNDVNLDAWDDIHQKKRPIDVPRLLDRLDRLSAELADEIGAKAKEKLFEQYPDWQNGASETVIDWTLPPLINYLLNRKLHGHLQEYGVPDFLAELRAEALKNGNGEMTHEELVRFLTERVLIRMLLYPLGQWVVGVQWTTLAIIAGWFATPVLLMWLTRRIVFWWKRRQMRMACGDKV